MHTGKAAPFRVPDGYFEELGSQIRSRINIEELGGTEKGFEAPPDYFDQMNLQIRTRVLIEEAKQTGHYGFDVPQNYFDTLGERLNASVRPQATLKKLWPAALKYGTAACVVLLAGVGLFYKQAEQPKKNTAEASIVHTNTPVADQYLYDIDENMVVEHVQEEKASDLNASPTQEEVENYILNHYSQNDLISAL